jgi:hypothetical protein
MFIRCEMRRLRQDVMEPVMARLTDGVVDVGLTKRAACYVVTAVVTI